MPASLIGGYMPLELPSCPEYYKGPGVLPVNCGRAALWLALKEMEPSLLHLPLYCCDSVAEPAERLGIPCAYYRMDERFLPVGLEPAFDEAVLWVNYYGAMPEEIIREVKRRYPRLILDNTHAFYEPPQEEAWNLYSCRKFFGVADGGYMIHEGTALTPPDPDTSYYKLHHRVKSIDVGWTDELTREYVENELTLADYYAGMSPLTRRMMGAVDAESARLRRTENYRVLHHRLGEVCGLSIAPQAPAMSFPILADEGLVERLLKRGIVAVNWWRHVTELAEKGSLEHRLASSLVQLPMDQRYTPDDMEAVANAVMEERKAR